MRTPGWRLVGILALALVSGIGAGQDPEDAYLRVYRAELSLEEPEAEARGRFVLDLEVVCNLDDACRYTYEVEELAPRPHTVEVGELEIQDDGSIGAEIRWPVEEEHCGQNWSGRVRIAAIPMEDGKAELEAEQQLTVRVPRRLCRKKGD
jgi:hypothetical protein